ncbi:TPR end-of-group domain-containing protein [Marinimicrobium agarilyticum]|uniref:TPR end-of-group domain-containing protein n=1 Tax=Marinimicrobium agarilyticum TaxID=306546 RepID=UPI00040FFE2D|nr:CDC27 family protein [Marinimicrobium agarilyticum]
MRSLTRLAALLLLCVSVSVVAQDDPEAEARQRVAEDIDQLEEPMYSPFIERYMLDELKQLRIDLSNQRAELIQQVVDRELNSVDRGVTYATNTVTYFFYLIAAVSSILVLLGWNSLRDIKEKMSTLADEEVGKLVNAYEVRLRGIEKQITQKSMHIDANREEIERTQEIHSLWLRANQEQASANKIAIYDQILTIKPDDCEALTYKADVVLELGEPQWAVNLCQQALSIDSDNAHAFYQLACAHTSLGHYEEGIHFLAEALNRAESYRESLMQDPALFPLHDLPGFQELAGNREEE